MAVLAALVLLGVFSAIAYAREPGTPTPGAVRIPETPSERAVEPAPAPTGAASSDPVVLSRPDRRSFWAPVTRLVAVRSRPAQSARVVGRLRTRTPEGTVNAVFLLERIELRGRLWLKVRLPVLPNNTVGWVPRESLGGYQTVTTHLVVDRRRLSAVLLRAGRPVFRARIAIGQSRWPTPAGRFYIRNKLTGYRSAFYGPIAFGTSARSAVLTDWPAGGFVGIHGTNRPDQIPGRISHGCIRLKNGDLIRLSRLMSPGTPLTIR